MREAAPYFPPMELIFLLILLIAVLYGRRRMLGLEGFFNRLLSGRLLSGRACKWRRDPTRRLGEQQRYVCATCGVDAYSARGAPRQCKRNLRGGL
ncbi:MAG: hypothetical protein MRY63_04695 [Neomegalonema sp.]|nr:hypothetical protein [Neomegalonema sp.]